jgi:hypothetical protein
MPESLIQFTEGSGKKVHTWQRAVAGQNVEDEVVILGEAYQASYIMNAQAAGLATANAHVFQLMAGTTNRVRVRRIEVHQRVLATGAKFLEMLLVRLTSAGTGGAGITPVGLDPAEAAAGFACMLSPTVKGSEGSPLAYANPYLIQTAGASNPIVQPILAWDFDRPRSKPLIIAAGAANGIALKNIGSDAGAQITFTIWADEVTYA